MIKSTDIQQNTQNSSQEAQLSPSQSTQLQEDFGKMEINSSTHTSVMEESLEMDNVDGEFNDEEKFVSQLPKDQADLLGGQSTNFLTNNLQTELQKGPWSNTEDQILKTAVMKYGPQKWSIIAQLLPGRIGKQCRERWHNHLNPQIKKDPWSDEEDEILMKAYQEIGAKWAQISQKLEGRTDNMVKNRYNSLLRRQMVLQQKKQGAKQNSSEEKSDQISKDEKGQD